VEKKKKYIEMFGSSTEPFNYLHSKLITDIIQADASQELNQPCSCINATVNTLRTLS